MTEMVTSGSMSGDARRSDGLLGESGHERRRSQQAPPVLYATARVLDSTSGVMSLVEEPLLGRSDSGGPLDLENAVCSHDFGQPNSSSH